MSDTSAEFMEILELRSQLGIADRVNAELHRRVVKAEEELAAITKGFGDKKAFGLEKINRLEDEKRELLAACREGLERLNRMTCPKTVAERDDVIRVREVIRAAIAKAEGGAK